MDQTLSKNKLERYLEWLIDEQEFNAKESINEVQYATKKECARVAKMLIELIERGDYNV